MRSKFKTLILTITLATMPFIVFAVDEVKDTEIPQVEAPNAEAVQAEAPNAEIKEPAGPVDEPAKLTPGNITMNFKGADIRTILSYISEVAGVDIVAAPDVKGIIDLKLTDKPWKVALDVIVRNYGFAYERDADIIRVVTLDKLKQEEVTTQAIALNYGRAKDVISSIEKIVSSRGKVKYDDRTNMLIVTDIPTNVYKVAQILEKLDKETDQVLIEARVLETVLGDDEKIGIDWNLKFEISGAKRPTTFPFDYFDVDNKYLDKYAPLVLTTPPTTTSISTDTGTLGAQVTAAAAAYPSKPAGGITPPGAKGFPFVDMAQDMFKDSYSFGTLDFSQFSAILEMVKSRAETSIVSNPRIATLNNTEANILVGQTLNMPKYERSSSTGKIEITGYEAKDLGIKLKVVPHINDKDEIVVDLVPEISDLVRYDTIDPVNGIVAPVFSSRQANTKVLIHDGDTIFIGGLIKENVIDVKKKMPLLGDILGDVPGVGLLFVKKEKTKQKTELIFFITVKIMKKDKQISDIPLAEKTYNPGYELSQDGWQKTVKKRKIK